MKRYKPLRAKILYIRLLLKEKPAAAFMYVYDIQVKVANFKNKKNLGMLMLQNAV